MDEIKTICNQLQKLDQNGTWYEIAFTWDDMTDIERYNNLGYIKDACNRWLSEGMTELHTHLTKNIIYMVNELMYI